MVNIILENNLHVIFIVMKKMGESTIYYNSYYLILFSALHRNCYFIKDFFKITDNTSMLLKIKK